MTIGFDKKRRHVNKILNPIYQILTHTDCRRNIAVTYSYNLGAWNFRRSGVNVSYNSRLAKQHCIHTLGRRQDGRHFSDDIFKWILLNEIVLISSRISLKVVPRGPINIIPSLVQITAWRRPGDKPLSEPMMVSLLANICVTRLQWINCNGGIRGGVRDSGTIALTDISSQFILDTLS